MVLFFILHRFVSNLNRMDGTRTNWKSASATCLKLQIRLKLQWFFWHLLESALKFFHDFWDLKHCEIISRNWIWTSTISSSCFSSTAESLIVVGVQRLFGLVLVSPSGSFSFRRGIIVFPEPKPKFLSTWRGVERLVRSFTLWALLCACSTDLQNIFLRVPLLWKRSTLSSMASTWCGSCGSSSSTTCNHNSSCSEIIICHRDN